jgi:hypothetical protein
MFAAIRRFGRLPNKKPPLLLFDRFVQSAPGRCSLFLGAYLRVVGPQFHKLKTVN